MIAVGALASLTAATAAAKNATPLTIALWAVAGGLVSLAALMVLRIPAVRLRARNSEVAGISEHLISELAGAVTAAPRDGSQPARHLLAIAHRVLQMVNPDADARLELYPYDHAKQCLRAMCLEGWPDSAIRRELPIAGHTPSGGASAAGKAWHTKKTQYDPDGPNGPAYKDFQDDCDQRCGRSRSILSIPLLRPEDPEGPPFAVLSVTSRIPWMLRTKEDMALAGLIAFALSVWFSNNPPDSQN
jgi:hypothetical protein